MGQRFIGWWGAAVVAIVVGTTPASAKDRKAATARDRAALDEMIAARQERPAIRQEASAAPAARSARSSSATELSSPERNGQPIAPLQEQPPVRSNPFRFNIGAVAVQPVVGGIKGAQFSIGF